MSELVIAEYDASENVLRLSEPLSGVRDHEKIHISIEKSTAFRSSHHDAGITDPLGRLVSLDAPTADIEQMLAEIEAGRR
jgi:hypothetical protein